MQGANFPQIMGILNVTPDSFYKDSRVNLDNVLLHAESMVNEGADILDVGGESTRPGASFVSVQEEMDRVLPVIEILAKNLECEISVDTQKPEVMNEAIKLGATFINDVNALIADNALQIAAKSKVRVCLMHKKGNPDNMQNFASYNDVLLEVKEFLQERIDCALTAGIAKEKIILDPGIGFAKNKQHNLWITKNLSYFKSLGFPLLFGASRKSFIGELLESSIEERLIGSVVIAALAALKGARIIRVHDVAKTIQAVKVAIAIQESELE